MSESAEVKNRSTAYITCTVGIQYTGKQAQRLTTEVFRSRIMERIEWLLETSRQDDTFDIDDFTAIWVDVMDTTRHTKKLSDK